MPQNSKLRFYNIVKSEITFQPYLTINEYERRRALAQLRSSNHRLNCETGRYDLNKSPKYHSKLELDNKLWRKCCKISCGPQAETLSHLPFFEPIIEDEHHFLETCPLYQNTRLQLNDTIKSAIVSWDTDLLKESLTVKTWLPYQNMYYSSWIQDFRKIKILPIPRPQGRKGNRRLEGIVPRTYISLWQNNHSEQSCHSPQMKQKS